MTNFNNLSDELKAKVKNCKTEEELKTLLAQENIELDAEMMEAVSGGACPPVLRVEAKVCPPHLRSDGNLSRDELCPYHYCNQFVRQA